MYKSDERFLHVLLLSVPLVNGLQEKFTSIVARILAPIHQRDR